MLSDYERASMIAAQIEALPDTGTVERKTLTDDGAGGFTETVTATSLPCRIGMPTGSYERAIAGQLGAVAVSVLTFPAGSDIGEADRVTVGTRSFEVKWVFRPTFETARRVLCVEVL